MPGTVSGRAHGSRRACPECSTASSAGFSLVELLIVIFVLLIAMGMVFQVTRATQLLHQREVRRTERSAAALRVVEEIVRELERAGFGLGSDVDPVLAGAARSRPAEDGLTIRSSPDGAMGVLLEDVEPGIAEVRVEGAEIFRAGDRVLLTDTGGPPVAAQVEMASADSLTVRDVDSDGDRPRRTILAARSARVRRVREVSYSLTTPVPGERRALARTIDGGAPTILVREVDRLRFDYHDGSGARLDPRRLARGGPRFVSIELALHCEPELPPLRSSVHIAPPHGTVAFDEDTVRLRLRRLMPLLPGAVGVASLPWAENGLVLFRDPVNGGSRILSFILERVPRDVRIDTLIGLPDVPPPVALFTGDPASTRYGGAWIAAQGGGGLEVWHLHPGPEGGISSASPLERVLVARDLLRVTGAVAGDVPGTLIVAERQTPALVHVEAGPSPRAPIVKRLATLSVPPVALARGRDGSLWVLLERKSAVDPGFDLVRFERNEEGRLGPPETAVRLPGRPRGLAVDPVRGWLYALAIDWGDSVLYELSPDALRPRGSPPPAVFRLSEWTEKVRGDPSVLRAATPSSSRGPRPFLPRRLRAVSFDGRGSLFLVGDSMVLEFTLGRPWAARHHAGIAAVVVQSREGGGPRLRLLGWAQPALAP
jgi:hypothetical protein